MNSVDLRVSLLNVQIYSEAMETNSEDPGVVPETSSVATFRPSGAVLRASEGVLRASEGIRPETFGRVK